MLVLRTVFDADFQALGGEAAGQARFWCPVPKAPPGKGQPPSPSSLWSTPGALAHRRAAPLPCGAHASRSLGPSAIAEKAAAVFTGIWGPLAGWGLLAGATSSPPAASTNQSGHVLQVVPSTGGLRRQGTRSRSLRSTAVTAQPQQRRLRWAAVSGSRACPWLLLVLLLLLLLGDAKELLATELLEGQLQDLLQDLLVTVSLREGLGLGLGLGLGDRGRKAAGKRGPWEKERAMTFALKRGQELQATL